MVEVVYDRVEVGSCMVVWRSGRVWSCEGRVVYGRLDVGSCMVVNNHHQPVCRIWSGNMVGLI